MLVNNMESVFKIFFKGMNISRVKSTRDRIHSKSKDDYSHIEQNLSELERKKIVNTRVRNDTKVKQFHAG